MMRMCSDLAASRGKRFKVKGKSKGLLLAFTFYLLPGVR
jgi:hypothetical protein